MCWEQFGINAPTRDSIDTKLQSKHIIQLQAKLEALNETESQKMATGGCAQNLFHPPKNPVPAKVLRTTSSGKFFRCV
jgi:hypothetical protein